MAAELEHARNALEELAALKPKYDNSLAAVKRAEQAQAAAEQQASEQAQLLQQQRQQWQEAEQARLLLQEEEEEEEKLLQQQQQQCGEWLQELEEEEQDEQHQSLTASPSVQAAGAPTCESLGATPTAEEVEGLVMDGSDGPDEDDEGAESEAERLANLVQATLGSFDPDVCKGAWRNVQSMQGTPEEKAARVVMFERLRHADTQTVEGEDSWADGVQKWTQEHMEKGLVGIADAGGGDRAPTNAGANYLSCVAPSPLDRPTVSQRQAPCPHA